MAWRHRRGAETVESGDDPCPGGPPSPIKALRHSRIAMAGGALAILSAIWLCSVRFIVNKLSSSALGASLGTMALGWWPATVLWSIALCFSTIGLALALRRRVRAAIPIMAISLCVPSFAWARWPTTNDLIGAARMGDSSRVERYLWLGVDVNRPALTRGGFGPPDAWKEGKTALTATVEAGQIDMVQCLLDHGADVNQTDGEGQTALVTAVHSGRPELIELLIARGAPFPIEDPAVSNSLMSELGRSWGPVDPSRLSRTVEILIRHGVNLEPVEIHDWAIPDRSRRGCWRRGLTWRAD